MLNGRTGYYQQAEMHRCLREKSLRQFYRFQRHIAGGESPVAQALNNTRHVHTILQELDSHGTGLDCLARDKSFDIWDKWASPRLRKKPSKEPPSGSNSVPWRVFPSGSRNIRIQSKTKTSKQIANWQRMGYFFVAGPLGGLKHVSEDVFGHIRSFKKNIFLATENRNFSKG